MKSVEIRGDGSSLLDGVISLCPHMGCAFKCCQFQQTGPIFLYPGEIEAAVDAGKSITHLVILSSNHHGGQLAECRAADTRSCDNGYKPLDCSSYPFFPAEQTEWVDTGTKALLMVKDEICPLKSSAIDSHRRYVAENWGVLLQRVPAVATWLKSIWHDDSWRKFW